MEIKYAKARQQGMHNFNRHSTPVDYVTMRNLQEYPNPPKEYLDKFKRIDPQKFNQEDLERIFVYSEYLKRKFYLECLYTSKKQSNNYTYKKNSFSSNEECQRYIENTFILEEDRLNFRIKHMNSNIEFLCSFEKFEYNIYKTIEYYFNICMDRIREFIANPEVYSNSKYITDDDINFLKNLNPISDYYYERLLYGMQSIQPYKPYKVEYENNNFSNTLRIINNVFSSQVDDSFLMLYRYIIDRHSIYMSDIFKLANIDNIIINNYNITNLSRFFFIPIEIKEEKFIKECINVVTDETNNNIKIDIKLLNNLNSLQIANYVYDTLLNALYFYKENKEMEYTVDELSYFINKLDSSNKHNKIDFCSRIHGLYIWDQILLYDNKKSIPMIYKRFNNKFRKNDEKEVKEDANIKYFYRVYNGTRKSIEEKSFCPLK